MLDMIDLIISQIYKFEPMGADEPEQATEPLPLQCSSSEIE